MSHQTKIEWADSTFNPWIGCTKVSPACDNCYAERDFDIRRHVVQWGSGQARKRTSPANWKLPLRWNASQFVQCRECGWRGDWNDADARGGCCPRCGHLPELFEPARRRVFCASLADVFDNEVDPAWRHDLFNLIESTPNLDWLLLTKRPQNIVRMVAEVGCVAGNGTRYLPGNVWLGSSVEDKKRADNNVQTLIEAKRLTGAAVAFLSIEPMLEDIDLEFEDRADGMITSRMYAIDWVIVGGESGPNARPMHPDWVRSIRNQCATYGVPFLFKQWGEWADWRTAKIVESGPVTNRCGDVKDWMHQNVCFADGQSAKVQAHSWTGHATDLMFRVGKKVAGRLLDGFEHNGFPS